MMVGHVVKFECKHCGNTKYAEHGDMKDVFTSRENCFSCNSLSFGQIRREIIPRGQAYEEAGFHSDRRNHENH